MRGSDIVAGFFFARFLNLLLLKMYPKIEFQLFLLSFCKKKKIEFSGEKLSVIAKFHSVFEKNLSFQNLRCFLWICVTHIGTSQCYFGRFDFECS